VTPEGKIKLRVDRLLKQYGAYYHKPVTYGFGTATLDYLGGHRGRAFAIETKKPGGKLTERQERTADAMRRNMTVFVVDGEDGLQTLAVWLAGVAHAED